MSRTELLRRGAVGGGAMLASASGLAALPRIAAAATPPPASDLAYVRLLIAAELLAVDVQSRALASGNLRPHASQPVVRRMRADERAHYAELANVMVQAGQTPATAADIDFSYPAGSFGSQASILKLADQIERLLLGAYLGAVQNLENPGLRLSIGKIAANEAQHMSAVAALEGRPVIWRAFPFALSMAEMSDALDGYES